MTTTTTTKPNSKAKKPLPVKFEDDAILGAPIQDEILKRIGEQAKDWEETPRPRREPVVAAPIATAEKKIAAASNCAGIPKWFALSVLVLLMAAIAGVAMLNLRTMELKRSVADLDAHVQQLSEKVVTWPTESAAPIEGAAETPEN
jgi:hypothetical protein